MKVFGYWINTRRSPRGHTRVGFFFVRLPGVHGFLAGVNAPLLGDCCLDVRRVA